jgi:hypothetical protein
MAEVVSLAEFYAHVAELEGDRTMLRADLYPGNHPPEGAITLEYRKFARICRIQLNRLSLLPNPDYNGYDRAAITGMIRRLRAWHKLQYETVRVAWFAEQATALIRSSLYPSSPFVTRFIDAAQGRTPQASIVSVLRQEEEGYSYEEIGWLLGEPDRPPSHVELYKGPNFPDYLVGYVDFWYSAFNRSLSALIFKVPNN